MNTPKISVLMATYNTPIEWLSKAIESVLTQTLSDFEFIIVDDCSTQSIASVKEKYTDSRIRWVKNDYNLGLTKSLNRILTMARGKYIARMDADDISLPHRFETQVNYMEQHPEVIVCGSYRRAFGKENKDEIWNIPRTREEQQVQLFFSNCGLTHPTAMFRKSMLDEFGIIYNENYVKAQDYGIWVQCTRYAPMAMIRKVLLQYRKSEQQISTAGRVNQLENDRKIKLDQLVSLGIKATDEEKDMHIAFCREKTYDDVDKLEEWVNRLRKANAKTKYFNQVVFERVLEKRWYDWCKKAYRTEKRMDARDAYKRARKLEFILKDTEITIKQSIVKMLRRGR